MDYMDKATRPALLYSGGKDSLAVLLLLRPWWDKLDVVWINTGNQFPEVVQHMNVVRRLVPRFTELHSDTQSYFAEHGFPVDVVPTSYTSVGQFIYGPKPVKVCSRFDCCNVNIWSKVAAFMDTVRPDVILRGDRSSERSAPPSKYMGAAIKFPIWEWSAERVLSFLEREARPLGLLQERHYMKEGSSLDCMTCSAYGCEHKERMEYLRVHHPALHQSMERFFAAYRQAVYEDFKEFL